MRLLVLIFVFFVGIDAKSLKLNNAGYYWRDWNVGDPIPVDAITGGITNKGHKTYIARTVYPQVGVIVPGKVSENDRKMWFEFDNAEHESIKDVSILCSLNHERFHWILTNMGNHISEVENNHQKLILAAYDRPKPVAIGRKKLGDVVHIGKVVIDPVTNKFLDMRVTEDGRGWGVTNKYEVLVYDNQEDDSESMVLEFY
ncbi:hypothetical protein FQR65_LT01927 [Abscondita terminalis]|nr:hypothetical protein FQR65_LT01927 [Abscondita terminalis]